MKHKNKKTVAIIDIGSSMVKMIVAEQKNNRVHKLDTLIKPLQLGHEVFNSGTISYECLGDLCEILNQYLAVMQEYAVNDYTAIATSALREAKNQNFVLDQIRVKTGISVLICDDSQEKDLIYYEVIRAVNKKNGLIPNKKTLISHTGTGSTGLCIYDDDAIIFAQTLAMGSLKIHDMLDDVSASNSAFDEAAEEYLDAVFNNIVMPFPNQMIDSLVMTGTEMDLIGKLCGEKPVDGIYRVGGDAIKSLFYQVKNNSLEQLSLNYHISEERAEMLYASLSIFSRLMNLTQAEEILIPKIELADAFLHKMLFANWTADHTAYMSRSAIACAKTFAKRYACDEKHYSVVTNHAVKLFDRLRRLHGFNDKHKTILQVAAILHDSGYFVNAKGGCAAELIRNLNICGLSGDDMTLVSLIANFYELNEPEFDSLLPDEQLLCSKLTAIFRLANSLDKSRKQKIKEIQVKIRGDDIILSSACDQNLYLEKWAMKHSIPFFKEAFGMQPILHIKSTMI